MTAPKRVDEHLAALRHPQHVEAVVFDVYGTLLDPASLVEHCRDVTDDPVGFVALWRRKQLEYTWTRALMDRYRDFRAVTADALAYAAEDRRVDLDPDVADRLVDAWVRLRPYPEVPGALARLSGLTLAVLSNGSPAMLEQGLNMVGLRAHLAHVLSVDTVATYKPSPRVYALAELALNLPRNRLLFVSANGWDAAGAAAFGLTAAWVNRTGGPADPLADDRDVVRVASLTELADLLTVGRPG